MPSRSAAESLAVSPKRVSSRDAAHICYRNLSVESFATFNAVAPLTSTTSSTQKALEDTAKVQF